MAKKKSIWKRIIIKLNKLRPLAVDAYPFEDDKENFQNKTPFIENLSGKKIVIYTCITGGYDNLLDPEFVNKNVKYVAFTDNISAKSDIWEVRNIPDFLADKPNSFINRYIKFHANELFADYDYAIYIDGNIKITSDLTCLLTLINPKIGLATYRHCLRDCFYEETKACLYGTKGNPRYIKKQIKRYKKEGFPPHFGLLECTLLFIQIGDNSKLLFSNWWDEFTKSRSGRDQLALPYTIWKMKLNPKDIAVIGTNVWKAKRFVATPHD